MNSLTIRRLVFELYLIIFILSLFGLVTTYNQFGGLYTSIVTLAVFHAFLASLLAYFVYEDGKERKNK